MAVSMADVETPIEVLKNRLTGLLADWGAELSVVLKELETKRKCLQELQDGAAEYDEELDRQRRQIQGQEELIDTLRADAGEASKLRREVHGKDLELDRLQSDISSKQELIRALRRGAEETDRLKGDGKLKDREIAELTAEKLKAEGRSAELLEELETLSDSKEQHNQDAAELEALRAELEARKTLINSLRADAERIESLEARLEEKQDVISKLETSISGHANTLVELKRSVNTWQRKYTELKASKTGIESTSTELPRLTQTGVRALERLEREAGGDPNHTVAIDMRESLLEARRTAEGASKK